MAKKVGVLLSGCGVYDGAEMRLHLDGLLVAATGIGVWMAMGISRQRGHSAILNRYPLGVITAEGYREKPSLALVMAAGGSVILALAIHAPWMALIPVVLLLFFFALSITPIRRNMAQQRDRLADLSRRLSKAGITQTEGWRKQIDALDRLLAREAPPTDDN